jgi:hypothetical protein
MFGDERGGGRNVKFGFKTMKNGDALDLYVEEVRGVVNDLNERFLRARFPKLEKSEVRELLTRMLEHGESREGVTPDMLLTLPDVKYFRRRGPHAFRMYDRDGKELKDFKEFRGHMARTQPESYQLNRDYLDFLHKMEQVAAGELDPQDAVHQMPALSRVGGACPCSNAVRWVTPERN